MDASTPLEELLQDLRSNAQFDSVGQFTVSLQKAMEKIRDLAQYEPARWLLYAIQAAVGWKVAGVELNFRPTGYSLVMEGAPESLPESELLSPRDFKDFHNALVWLRALAPRQMDLLYQGPGGGYLLALAEDPPVRASQPASAQARLSLSVAFRDNSAERTAVYVNQVSTRLAMCPLPITLEGQTINTGVFSELAQEGCLACRYILPAQGSRSLLAALHPQHQPALSYRVADCEYEREREVTPAARVSRLEIGGPWSGDCQLRALRIPEGLVLAEWERKRKPWFLCNSANPLVQLPEPMRAGLLGCRAYFQRTREAHSTLFVIQRGCSLHGVELSKAPRGWWVALASDSLSTDLSGSTLVMDEALQRSLEWVIGQIFHVHQRMSNSRS